MNRLLRADFYKLRKNKSFWVCLILVVLMAAAMIFMQDMSFRYYPEMFEIPPTAAGQLQQSLGGQTTLLAAIVISVFIGAEFANGTIKNTASSGFSRSGIYLSKLLVSFVISMLLLVLSVVVSTLLATCLWGFGTVAAGFWSEFFKMFGLIALLNLAYTALFALVTSFLRQSGGAIAVNICLMSFVPTFTQLGELLIHQIFHKEVAITKYLLSSNISAVLANPTLSGETALQALLVGLCFLVVCIGLGLWAFRKRDIK